MLITGLPSKSTRAARDAFGRERQAWYPDGSEAHRTFYGARWTTVFDANDLSWEEHLDTPSIAVTDGQGRAVRSFATLEAGGTSKVLVAETTYDVLGNILTIERGEGATTGDYTSAGFVTDHTTKRSLRYDSLGRRAHNLDPDSGFSQYAYNRLGELTRFVDGRGEPADGESRFLYDMAGRLIAEDHRSDGADWVPAVDGHSTDDDAPVSRQATLAGELFGYVPDTDHDFEPEAGADVLYFFDHGYADEPICASGPGRTPQNLLGALAWVRDGSGCAWSSYDERGRPTWAARQIAPSTQVFVTESFYESELGPDDMDRVGSETYPDGTSAHYTYSPRGLLDRVTGDAPDSGWLFDNRTFVDDIRYDEFGQRRWIRIGQGDENQVGTCYAYDDRRRLTSLTSVLDPVSGGDRTLIENEYHFDEVGNLVSVLDQRTVEGTSGWSPEPVDYAYEYDPLYRLITATPTYGSGNRPLDISGTPDVDEERAGEQAWEHDYLGSMQTWNAVEEVAGEHFHDAGWSLGTIVNGQQLIEAEATTGVSSRCSAIPEADARASGPAPHALYFAYESGAVSGEYEGVEACYDAAGNMVALYRLHLTGCGGDPLDEANADWFGGDCTDTPVWSLLMTWDAVGRLIEVEKRDDAEVTVAHLLNGYDASNARVIRLDLLSTEGDDQATLYVSPGYEIRDAALQPDSTYLGGEVTKYVFAGADRIARVVERTVNGVLPWPNEPGEPHVFYTLTNHLGSASVTVNAEQVPGQDDVIVAQTQFAYGADDALVESEAFSWRPDYEFTGKEEDPDSGLMYFGARFYSSGLGRWVSTDPLAVHGLVADLNQYRYVIGNPLVLVDPSGLDPIGGDVDPGDEEEAQESKEARQEGVNVGTCRAVVDSTLGDAMMMGAYNAQSPVGGELYGDIDVEENAEVAATASEEAQEIICGDYNTLQAEDVGEVQQENVSKVITAAEVVSAGRGLIKLATGIAKAGRAIDEVADLVEDGGKATSQTRRRPVKDLADGELHQSRSTQSPSVSVFEPAGDTGQALGGRSAGGRPGAQPIPSNSLVGQAYAAVPPKLRSIYHGRCSEGNSLYAAERAGQPLRGGTMETARVDGTRMQGPRASHGTNREPCSSCREMMRILGVIVREVQ